MGKAIAAYEDRMIDGQTRLHRFRYYCSRGFVEPEDVVLDLGCGTGYGTDILAGVAKKVIGIDVDEVNVTSSKNKFGREGVDFLLGDMEKMDIPPADVAVAMETIEHTYDPKEVFNKLKKAVDRLIIVSVPIGKSIDTDITHHFEFFSINEVKDMVIDGDWEIFYFSLLHSSAFLVFLRRERYGL